MIVVVGLSHHSAPIEIREKAALSPEQSEAFLRRLLRDERVPEAFLVSTCNRVELFAAATDASEEALLACATACREVFSEVVPEAREYLYVRQGVDGIRHLLRVSASLDSLVVGEPQILGQLKQGFERAKEIGAVGGRLHRVFARALRSAKRVRHETMIGSGQVSIPSIAVELALQIFGSLRGHTAALIGAGEMGQAVAKLLADSGAKVLVVGRSLEKLELFAKEVGGTAVPIDEIDEVLVRADVIVSSTSSPHHVITRAALDAQRRARRGRNLFLIDLAVPRDVEPTVGELDGVFLYNIDDLSQVADQSAQNRQKEAARAASLVEDLLTEFLRWADAEQATPVIKALRAKLRIAVEVELEKSLRGKLRDLDSDQRQAVVKLLEASLNRMLHGPTMMLREEAANDDSGDELAMMLSSVFELRDVPAEQLDRSGFGWRDGVSESGPSVNEDDPRSGLGSS